MPEPTERETIQVRAERTIVAAVRLPNSDHDPENPFGELKELAAQAGAVVVGELEQHRQKPQSGTYLGKGKLEELRELCELTEASTIIFDHELSPRQIANIEKETDRKVLDRSELILDIFASRATTHEAQLQVELAQLEYTYPRLRAMWDHLERIVGSGGIGGVGTRGPGEQQLEIDRRLVQRRKLNLKRELATILSRKRRSVRERNQSHFTVGLVGYTNAGKSTLFNSLTAGGAYADDRLFATLMTRTRAWDLGNGDNIMLSDTVGFVRDLPHHLVASFRATLEEATHADLLLIVLDVSDPAAEMHLRTVNNTLDAIFKGLDTREDGPIKHPDRLLLLNKTDLLRDNASLVVWQQREPSAIPVCSLSGDDGGLSRGSDALHDHVRLAAHGPVSQHTIRVPLREGKLIHTLETRGEIIDREYEGDAVSLTIRMGDRLIWRLCKSVSGVTGLDQTDSRAANSS